MTESCQIVERTAVLSCANIVQIHHAKNALKIRCFVELRVQSSCASGLRGFCLSCNSRNLLPCTQIISCSSLRCPIEAEDVQTETMATLDARHTSGHNTTVFKSLNLQAQQPALVSWPIALPNPTFDFAHGLAVVGRLLLPGILARVLARGVAWRGACQRRGQVPCPLP